jgi:hypothetical protein
MSIAAPKTARTDGLADGANSRRIGPPRQRESGPQTGVYSLRFDGIDFTAHGHVSSSSNGLGNEVTEEERRSVRYQACAPYDADEARRSVLTRSPS